MPNLEQVMQEHGGAIRRVIASYAPPGAERDDLAHDVAVALLRGLPRFRGECPLKGYVLRIAHNQGLQHAWKRKSLRLESEEVDVASPRPGPEALAASREGCEHLLAAIRELPVGQRQVLTLVLEELPHAEIGELLGLSENAVAVRLHRARAALRERLARRGGPAPRDDIGGRRG